MQVYLEATAVCNTAGDNASGCAIAEAFGTSFAAACAAASAEAIAAISADDCDCGGELELLADAFAAETVRIFAAVEQVLGAEACAGDGFATDAAESRGVRNCSSRSYALASASAMAAVWADRSCAPAPADCVEKCETAPNIAACEGACAAEFWSEADAAASARAEIEVSTREWCTGNAIGDVWYSNFADSVRAHYSPVI